ncbi:MAG: energy transducer TonB [Candidatus Acidiferrales bacterium]
MRRLAIQFSITCLLVITISQAFACAAQRQSRDFAPGAVEVSELQMSARLIHRVAPEYPAIARGVHAQGPVVMHAIIGKDGSILQLQAISGNPLLIRAALVSVSKWRYEPVVRDGEPVEVKTTITVEFELAAERSTRDVQGRSQPLTIPESGTSSQDIVHLKNGQTIHADTITDDGDKIEYMIGDGVYEIPKTLVASIVHSPDANPLASGSASWQRTGAASVRVTGRPLPGAPKNYGDEQKNWYLFESTSQLRDECQSGQFEYRLHPEFESTTNFPDPTGAKQICAILEVDMGSDYERLVDRGVELNRILCNAGHGQISAVRYADAALAADQDELGRVSAEFQQLMNGSIRNPNRSRAAAGRMMIDFYRIAGTCGHGM